MGVSVSPSLLLPGVVTTLPWGILSEAHNLRLCRQWGELMKGKKDEYKYHSVFPLSGVVLAKLESVECDAVPVRYSTVKRARSIMRIPV